MAYISASKAATDSSVLFKTYGRFHNKKLVKIGTLSQQGGRGRSFK
jgi:hypothetical protein